MVVRNDIKKEKCMRVDFNQPIQRKNTFCTKYDGMAASFGRDDLLPLWIADMDFPVPDEVTPGNRAADLASGVWLQCGSCGIL